MSLYKFVQYMKDIFIKSLIFIKSTVLALSIILVALVIAFLITKNKKEMAKEEITKSCKKESEVMIDNEMIKIESEGRIINVLTKVDEHNRNQELITIDSFCGNEIGRINFKIKK